MSVLLKSYQLVIIILLFYTTTVIANQNKDIDSLSIKGVTTGVGNSNQIYLDSITINIYNLNTKFKTINSYDGTYNFLLPLNSYIVVEFEKENFVSKRIVFYTGYNGSLKKVKPFDLEIALLKEVEGVDFSELDFPITLVQYDKDLKDFVYNATYTKEMLSIQSDILKDLK